MGVAKGYSGYLESHLKPYLSTGKFAPVDFGRLSSKKRGLARNYMKLGARIGINQRDTLRAVRELGLGYRNAPMQADYNEFKAIRDRAESMAQLSPSRIPTFRHLTRGTERLSRSFSQSVRFETTYLPTGDKIVEYRRIPTDRPLSQAQVDDILRRDYPSDGKYQEIAFTAGTAETLEIEYNPLDIRLTGSRWVRIPYGS